MLTILKRYRISAPLFLAAYLGSQIFGASVWHFVAVNVQHWWRGHGAAGLISGLVGMAVFIGVSEHRRRERVERGIPGAARRQPSGPWA